jgi:hypothetical protein
MCAAALLIACAQTKARSPTTPASASDSAVVQLPRTAYLMALDASLPRVRGRSPRVLVIGEGALPITAEDLKTRQAVAGNVHEACPKEASITFGIPTQQPDGRILLHVIEDAPPIPPLGHIYLFRCNGATCRLERDGQLEEDYIRACPLEMHSADTAAQQGMHLAGASGSRNVR